MHNGSLCSEPQPGKPSEEWAELAYQFSRLRRWRDPELARECLRMMFDHKRIEGE